MTASRPSRPGRPFKQDAAALLRKEYAEFLEPDSAHLAMETFAELPPEEREAHQLRVSLLGSLAVAEKLDALRAAVVRGAHELVDVVLELAEAEDEDEDDDEEWNEDEPAEAVMLTVVEPTAEDTLPEIDVTEPGTDGPMGGASA